MIRSLSPSGPILKICVFSCLCHSHLNSHFGYDLKTQCCLDISCSVISCGRSLFYNVMNKAMRNIECYFICLASLYEDFFFSIVKILLICFWSSNFADYYYDYNQFYLCFMLFMFYLFFIYLFFLFFSFLSILFVYIYLPLSFYSLIDQLAYQFIYSYITFTSLFINFSTWSDDALDGSWLQLFDN